MEPGVFGDCGLWICFALRRLGFETSDLVLGVRGEKNKIKEGTVLGPFCPCFPFSWGCGNSQVRDKVCTVSLLLLLVCLSVSLAVRVCKRRYPPKEAFVDRRGIEICLTPRTETERESFVLVRERPAFFFFFFFWVKFVSFSFTGDNRACTNEVPSPGPRSNRNEVTALI